MPFTAAAAAAGSTSARTRVSQGMSHLTVHTNIMMVTMMMVKLVMILYFAFDMNLPAFIIPKLFQAFKLSKNKGGESKQSTGFHSKLAQLSAPSQLAWRSR